jgi:hypothetical protein
MREICTSGLMSGEGKRIAHATPRLSSTLPRYRWAADKVVMGDATTRRLGFCGFQELRADRASSRAKPESARSRNARTWICLVSAALAIQCIRGDDGVFEKRASPAVLGTAVISFDSLGATKQCHISEQSSVPQSMAQNAITRISLSACRALSSGGSPSSAKQAANRSMWPPGANPIVRLDFGSAPRPAFWPRSQMRFP